MEWIDDHIIHALLDFLFLTQFVAVLLMHPTQIEKIRVTQISPLVLAFMSTLNSARAKSNLEYLEKQNVPLSLAKYLFVNYATVNTSSSLSLPQEYHDLLTTTTENSYINMNETTMYKAPGIVNQKEAIRQWADLLLKFLFSMRYFLYETKSQWFWRGTDDTIVDKDNLRIMVAQLNTKYDRNDTVFLGNCIDIPTDNGCMPFIQGGSGILMSRRAVEVMIPLIEKRLHVVHEPDDLILADAMNEANCDWQEATSEYFMGLSIGAMPKIEKNEKIRACPPLHRSWKVQKKCKPQMPSIRNLVFYHEQIHVENDNLEMQRRWEILKNAPITTKFYMNYGIVEICRGRA